MVTESKVAKAFLGLDTDESVFDEVSIKIASP